MADRFKPGAWLTIPVITPARAWFAMTVAVITDLLQILLGPLGWFFAVQVLDVLAMLLLTRAIGFHPLLLPTFVAELLPVVDFLPTWSGCTAVVLTLRKRHHSEPKTAQATVVETESTVSPEPPPAPGKRLPPP